MIHKETIPDTPAEKSDLLHAKKYTIPQASKLVGIGQTNMRRMISDGEIPVLLLGKKMLLLEGDLERYLKNKYVRINAVKTLARPRMPPLPDYVRNSPHLKLKG